VLGSLDFVPSLLVGRRSHLKSSRGIHRIRCRASRTRN
jgi:hypothetical protein